jgi:hypothetical protein
MMRFATRAARPRLCLQLQRPARRLRAAFAFASGTAACSSSRSIAWQSSTDIRRGAAQIRVEFDVYRKAVNQQELKLD